MRVVAPAVVLIASLVPALAGTGWNTAWDYPGQGADWYGATHDLRRDYEPTGTDLASNGDDYGLGYAPEFDRLHLGPPVALTNAGGTEYVFRFDDRVSEGNRCYVDLDCADGVFCNGVEHCSGRSCYAGSPPACDDLDPCTADSCNVPTDACRNVPSRAPEVSGLRLSRRDALARLTWDTTPGARYYNVYRGVRATGADVRCFRQTEVTWVDDDEVLPKRAFFHLVTAVGCEGESTLGTGSDGTERLPYQRCP